MIITSSSKFQIVLKYCFSILLILCSLEIWAQQDSTVIDTVQTAKSTSLRINKVKNHSPLKAVLFSAVLPGSGQAYNKKYWKMPIIYAGLGGMAYAVYFNNTEYQHFRKAYLYRVDGDPNTIDEYENRLDNGGLKSIRDSYRKQLELSYIGLFFIYTLNLADAFVDAHLFEFDVNDELAIKINPQLTRTYQNTPQLTLGVQMKF